MKWLTTEHIQAQAKKGRKEALECSIEHWRQLAGATFKELLAGSIAGETHYGPAFCALCLRYEKGCGYCPLKQFGKGCHGVSTQYRKAEDTDFFERPYDKHDLKNYNAFHREAKKMLKVLKDVHKKLYG